LNGSPKAQIKGEFPALKGRTRSLTLVTMEGVYLSMEVFLPFDGVDLPDISIQLFI
jgi:hypothetical protein